MGSSSLITHSLTGKTPKSIIVQAELNNIYEFNLSANLATSWNMKFS